jgi:hypothetical protein
MRPQTARPSREAPLSLLRRHIGDPDAAWSLGVWGGVGEFRFDRGEPCEIDLDGPTAITPRGALCAGMLDATVALEIRSVEGRLEEIAFCLPADLCGPARTDRLTERGPDGAAARPADRRDVLFDLGLGAAHVEALVRLPAGDAGAIAALRACCGRSLFGAGHAAAETLRRANPPRIFRSPVARLEVYTPIPPPGGTSPEGPHTHILPHLLRQRRAHAPDSPIPDGWYCCLSLYPGTDG